MCLPVYQDTSSVMHICVQPSYAARWTWNCLRAVLHYEVIAVLHYEVIVCSEVRGGSALVEAGPKLSRDKQCVGFETHLDTLSYPSGGN